LKLPRLQFSMKEDIDNTCVYKLSVNLDCPKQTRATDSQHMLSTLLSVMLVHSLYFHFPDLPTSSPIETEERILKLI
jgi:hypothetical protein